MGGWGVGVGVGVGCDIVTTIPRYFDVTDLILSSGTSVSIRDSKDLRKFFESIRNTIIYLVKSRQIHSKVWV